MIKHYFRFPVGNLLKNSSYPFIRMGGLAIGLASSILILLYVQYELSYDRFHRQSENIYRLCTLQHPYHPPQTAGILADGLPEVSAFTRILPTEEWILKYGDRQFKEKEIAFVDPDFFKIFSFKLLDGNPETVLTEPFSVVLSEDLAEKIFGDENPVGKSLTLRNENEHDYTVRGIMENMPGNSHFRYGILAGMTSAGEAFGEDWMNNWGWGNFLVYFRMQEHFSRRETEAKCGAIIARYQGWEQVYQDPEFWLQPLRDIHLHSRHFVNDIQPQNSITRVLVFTAIGLLILFIACINYVNLMIARTPARLTEIGIKKAIGVTNKQLFIQHISESLIEILLTFFLAVLLVILCLPHFNMLTGTSFSITDLNLFNLSLGLVCLMFVTTLLAGSYPALVFSSGKPMDLLRNLVLREHSNFSLSKLLVGIQFSIIILLIGCSLFMFRQVDFIENKELGYDKEHLLISALPDELTDDIKFRVLKQSLLDLDEVSMVSGASCNPSDGLHNREGFMPEGSNEWINMPVVHVRQDYFEIMGLKAAQGRLFSGEFETDVQDAIVLNESAVGKLGLKDHPLGKTIRCSWPESERKIIGTIDDFHFESLYEPTKPTAFIPYSRESWQLLIRTVPGDLSGTLSAIGEVCSKVSPGWIFEFRFLDTQLDQLYRVDKTSFLLMRYFTIIALVIACMGLYGLASIMTQNKTREIGIRKVNGAKTFQIVFLLNQQFVILVGIAYLAAAPLIWVAMNNWFRHFAYKTGLSAWIFILTGVIALLIALLTVSGQSWKAASNNPVRALRYE